MTLSHFRDFTLQESPEVPAPVMMSHVFQRMHHRIVQHGVGKVAVSFPEYGRTLGNKLRLHGTKEHLEEFGTTWLKLLARMVPPDASSQVFARRQVNKGGPSWRRRYERRHAGAAPDGTPSPTSQDPFVRLRSGSNGHYFYLRVALRPDAPMKEPDTFGLGVPTPKFP